jgi:uncharacterized DUF497 family protein
MRYDWDPAKAAANLANHKVPFKAARRFLWALALEMRDTRKPYTEVRTIAVGLIGARVHVLVYTMRGKTCRVISLRKAKTKEVRLYVDFTKDL